MIFFDKKYCTKILQQIGNAIGKDNLLLTGSVEPPGIKLALRNIQLL